MDKYRRTKNPYDTTQGILCLTCLKNRRQYFVLSTDLSSMRSKLLYCIKNSLDVPEDLTADIRRYGGQFFRTGLVYTVQPRYKEDDAAYMQRALRELREEKRRFIAQAVNPYNTILLHEQIIERAAPDELGTTAKSGGVPQRHWNNKLRCPGIFVITRKKTGQQFVGKTNYMYKMYSRFLSNKREGYWGNKDFLADIESDTPHGFTIEFCPVEGQRLFAVKKEVMIRLRPSYNTPNQYPQNMQNRAVG